ncbi:MAG TPA: oxygenase MpaB family protein [Mycobacteriales bacterium]|nr:oxygenase MpaB family protein [Mycobacteriales bacterium]
MNALQRRIVDTIEGISGTHDDPAVYGGPAGDPGLCGPDSVSWKINSDLSAVGRAGTSAIVMELLHPSVMAGVQQLSSYREDPFRRARTTLGYVLATTFGNTEAATALIDKVRHIHGFVEGHRPDGVPFRALDPKLLAWVHTMIPWMILRSYERYNSPLSAEEKDRYLKEQALIGRMAGASGVPESMAELADFVDAMRPELAVTAQLGEFFEFLLTAPFLPTRTPRPIDRALHAYFVRAGMSLAPDWVRQMTGYHHSSVVQTVMFEPYLRADARLTRWAFDEPKYVALAKARVARHGEVAAVDVAAGNRHR